MSVTISQGLRMSARAAMLALMCSAALSCASSAPVAETPVADAYTPPPIHPEIWPQGRSGVSADPRIEAEVARILAQMTLEDKVGQVIQADVNSVTPDEVRQYRLGSVLNGGNSGPGGNDRALAPEWLDYADRFYDASMAAYGDRIAIPIIWGSDSVHGNANIIGATIFPHNIGLGAARNPALMERIGEITALETRVTGQDWTFAPTIAVVRDDRWGRTYEAYSEDPRIVAEYAPAIVRGIQGSPGDEDFLRGPHILATVKHFLGDGGTNNGVDQGDNQYSEEQLRDIFAPGYPTAIAAGVQSLMPSYNSWHGEKMHGFRAMLTDVLRGRMGFNGFTIGDWNGHGQVRGCTPTNCAASFNAGLDMYMAPDSWRDLYANTLAQARSGEIPMARLDEAVSRILRVKLMMGVFETGRPSSRPYSGDFDLLGSAEHRAVARQAVRESIVLLKNEDAILPLRPRQNILVAGSGADNLEQQTGGWTISWQGVGNARTDFPNGQTIYEAIREQVQGAGGTATLSVDGNIAQRVSANEFCPDMQTCQASRRGGRPEVAIVVFGEQPYAEFQGDRPNLDYTEEGDLALIRRLRAQNIPVVAVFLSGRPMYVTPEINASNAFVAAFLPGSEGAGIADVLLRDSRNRVQHDFRGRLSFSWPRAPDQVSLNIGDANYNPLFNYDYGMTYAEPRNVGELPEASADAAATVAIDRYYGAGSAASGWRLFLREPFGPTVEVNSSNAQSPNRALTLTRFDRAAQEDSLRASWNGNGASALVIAGSQIDVARQANGDITLAFDVLVESPPTAPVTLGVGCAGENCRSAVDITDMLRNAQGWTRIAVRLTCFGQGGARLDQITEPFVLQTAGRVQLGISEVRLAQVTGSPTCPPAVQ